VLDLLVRPARSRPEIGGAWLIWQGAREHRGGWWIGPGIFVLGFHGFVAT